MRWLNTSTNLPLAFLVANLLTGAVNLALPTMHVSDAFAALVLLVYLSVMCGVVTLLEARGARWAAAARTFVGMRRDNY